MSLEEFTQKFADCFYQADPQSIKPDTEFKKVEEWGSMMALIVIAMVDAECGKTITAEDLKSARTVADLFDAINSK
jgi:acyl carrier protein